MPPPGRLADAARQRDVFGHERRQLISWRRAQPRDPKPEERRGEARRPRSRGPGRPPAPAGQVEGEQAPARLQLWLGRLPASRDALLGSIRSRSDGPAGSSTATRCGRRSARRAVDERLQVETPTSGTSSPFARPLAVASPTRNPVNAPGPVPTTTRRGRRGRARPPSSLDRRREELLAVAVAALHDASAASPSPSA